MVIDGGRAFATFQDALYGGYRAINLTDDYICSSIFHLYVIGSRYPGAMFVKKHSPYKEPLNVK
jgi:hypothetical protein